MLAGEIVGQERGEGFGVLKAFSSKQRVSLGLRASGEWRKIMD